MLQNKSRKPLSLSAKNSYYDAMLEERIMQIPKLIINGQLNYFETLKEYASSENLKIREAVLHSLDQIGDFDIHILLIAMKHWSSEIPEVQSIAIEVISQEKFLTQAGVAYEVIEILDSITHSIVIAEGRNSKVFKDLKKALIRGWVKATLSFKSKGIKSIERWIAFPDKDIRAVVLKSVRSIKRYNSGSDLGLLFDSTLVKVKS